MTIDEELPKLNTYRYQLEATFRMVVGVKAPDKYTADEILRKAELHYKIEDLIDSKIIYLNKEL